MAEKILTRKDVFEIVSEATDAILKGMDQIVKNMVSKEEFQAFDKKVDNRFNKIENDIGQIKDDVKGIKAELSVTVTKKEFNKLKSRVDKYHPVN